MNDETRKAVIDAWQRQFGPWEKTEAGIELVLHPYTCGKRTDHPYMAGDKGVLVPTVRGWICPFCDYTQPLIVEVLP